MITEIRTFLIHLLGGYTKDDVSIEVDNIISQRMDMEFENKKRFISLIMQIRGLYLLSRSLYGTPADEWCKTIYDNIASAYEYAIDLEFKD